MKRKKGKVGGEHARDANVARSYRPYFSLLPFAFSLTIGCADTKGPTTRPVSVRDRQNNALRDPFGYGPKDEVGASDMPRVSSGKINEFDEKGFKRDVNRVLNP